MCCNFSLRQSHFLRREILFEMGDACSSTYNKNIRLILKDTRKTIFQLVSFA